MIVCGEGRYIDVCLRKVIFGSCSGWVPMEGSEASPELPTCPPAHLPSLHLPAKGDPRGAPRAGVRVNGGAQAPAAQGSSLGKGGCGG